MTETQTKDKFDDIRSEGLVGKVQEAFAFAMRDSFQESQLVAMDYQNAFVYEKGICASHDFCDANMFMLDAFAEAVAKQPGVTEERARAFASAFVSSAATPEAKDRVMAIWGEAWTRAGEAGFSALRQAIPPDDFKALAPYVMLHPENHSGRYPSVPDNALSEREHAPQDLIDGVEREEIGAAMLIAMAEAIRDKDDAKLGSLLDDLFGPAAPAP